MKIVMVGGGRIAYFLSRNFLSMGHSVTIVNRDANECRGLARRTNATILCGDGSYPKILEEAGTYDADVVLAITPRDEDNLVICQIADKQFGVSRTLAVVSDPDNEEVFPKLGVKNVVSITRVVASLINERTAAEEITNLIALGEGRVHITEMTLAGDCPVLDLPLMQVPLPADSLIGCIIRGDNVIVPHGATTLAAGDKLVLITVPKSHGDAVRMLTGEP